ITGRLYIGSIDAARNIKALQRLRIGGTLALLGTGEEDAAVSSHSSEVSGAYGELQITRTIVEIEDSKDGDLLRRLPGILAALKKLIEKAEQDDTRVLVHCIAGRSRSASVLAAWMIIREPKQQGVQDIVDRIRIIRPWIEINPYFMKDLHLLHAVNILPDGEALSAENSAQLNERTFPRLDFGADLVEGILRGTKTITMRLVSDVEGDLKSDLRDIFSYSIVAATTASADDSSTRPQFAYLRINEIETQELSTIDQATLLKSGFSSTDEVLTILKQFYPTVTTSTPLLMLHFQCLCSYPKFTST
ncbi:Dual specificity phosphatase, partial [Phytophthora palmivora]